MSIKTKRTERVKIPIGFKCNLRCRFCYYLDCVSKPFPPTESIKKIMKFVADQGIKDIDFSGGEPTIRPDLPKLISFAKDLNFRDICVITNGIVMSNENYTHKLIKNGLNDVLFSIQGPDAKIHEYLTRYPGGFEKILKSIETVKETGIKLRTNTTVNSMNFKHLPRLSNLLLDFKPTAVNFIQFNTYWKAGNAAKNMSVRYLESSVFIKKAIDILNPHVNKITVRYMPFCFMTGYEKHLCNFKQLRYDTDEWATWEQYRIETNALNFWIRILGGFIITHPINNLWNKNDLLDEIVSRGFLLKYYTKNENCKSCIFDKDCDGLQNTYVLNFGFDNKPVLKHN